VTLGYDLERMVVALERTAAAVDALYRHDLPDWLAHRLALIRSEAESLKTEIKNTTRKECSKCTKK
jgi:hypothetical protein